MRRSIILFAVAAVGGMFASWTIAQTVTDSTRSASITIHGLTESKTPYPQGFGIPFNQTVQDSYNDGTGSPFGINEAALSQQTSSIAYINSNQTLDVSVGGTVSFNMVGEDYVETDNSGLVTFMLNSPAAFSLTESSSLEGDRLGTDGETWCYGGTLVPGTSPVVLFEPNLIPYIFTLAQEPGAGSGTLNPITGEPNLTYSGTLAPGTYTYRIFAGGDGTDHEGGLLTFSSDFQITPTPEPVALPLLGMTALALLRRRSRRTANC